LPVEQVVIEAETRKPWWMCVQEGGNLKRVSIHWGYAYQVHELLEGSQNQSKEQLSFSHQNLCTIFPR
jgi:hypothetical protein